MVLTSACFNVVVLFCFYCPYFYPGTDKDPFCKLSYFSTCTLAVMTACLIVFSCGALSTGGQWPLHHDPSGIRPQLRTALWHHIGQWSVLIFIWEISLSASLILSVCGWRCVQLSHYPPPPPCLSSLLSVHVFLSNTSHGSHFVHGWGWGHVCVWMIEWFFLYGT